MYAYNEIYLDEIVETQGELFEKVIDLIPQIDVEHFVEQYLRSKTRFFLDKGNPFIATKNYIDLYAYFVQTDNFIPIKGKEFDFIAMNWIGQFYAYYQWYTTISSSDLVQRFPLKRMLSVYPGLHDLDLKLAVEKVISYCKGENIYDEKSNLFPQP